MSGNRTGFEELTDRYKVTGVTHHPQPLQFQVQVHHQMISVHHILGSSLKSPTQFTQSITGLMSVVKANQRIMANLARRTVSQKAQGSGICQA